MVGWQNLSDNLTLATLPDLIEYIFTIANIIIAGVKNVVFDTWLVHDTWLIGLGGLFVIGCMWLYCGSFLLTMATCLAITYSIIISYFLYRIVFNLKFFPFMNLLTAVVAVGLYFCLIHEI